MVWGDRWDDLRSLVSRLGNGTESVRTEALKSIMFKLKHGMYSAWEVSEHAAIFSYLLEWFNRPSPPLLDDALDLLSVLARDERGGGARTLIEVGGIAFLQAWRRHAHSSVHGRIDSLLNFLLTLPAPSHNAPHAGDWWKDSAHSGQAVGREESALLSQPSAISAMSLQNTSHASVSRSGGGGRSWEGGGATTATTSSWTAPHIIRAPAPGAARQHGPVLQQGGGEQWEFTTIPLSREDKQLLFEAEVKLRVTDSSAVRGVLSYISSALIEDFPPEVLLQRPEMLRSILALLNTTEPPGSPHASIEEMAAAVTQKWLKAMHRSVRLHLVKELRSGQGPKEPRQHTVRPNSDSNVPPAAFSSPSHGGAGMRPSDETYPFQRGSLEMGVLGLEECGHLILSKCVPLLQHQSKIADTLAILRLALALLRSPFPSDSEQGMRGERMSHHLQGLSAVVAYHGREQVMSCRLRVSILPFIVDVVDSLPPLARRALVPPQLCEVLGDVLMNPYLDVAYPDLRARCESHVLACSPEAHNLHRDAETVLASVLRIRAGVSGGPSGGISEPLRRVEEALPGLAFETCQSVISLLVECASRLSMHEAEGMEARLRGVLLKAMSCDNSKVRKQVYSLLVERLTHQKSEQQQVEAANVAAVLLDAEVVYELVAYGLSDHETHDDAGAILEIIVEMSGKPLASEFIGPCLALIPGTVSCAFAGPLLPSMSKDMRALHLVRLMLHADETVRRQASSELLSLLPSGVVCRQESGHDPLHFLEDADVLKSSLSARPGGARNAGSGLGELNNLMGLLLSDTLKDAIKVSALEQIGQMAGLDRPGPPPAGLLEAVKALLNPITSSPPLIVASLSLLSNMLRPLRGCGAHSRAVCAGWGWVGGVLAPLLYHPSEEVRGASALALAHVVFDQDLVRARGAREQAVYEQELVVPCSDANNKNFEEDDGAFLAPTAWRDCLLPGLPCTMYALESPHRRCAISFDRRIEVYVTRATEVRENHGLLGGEDDKSRTSIASGSYSPGLGMDADSFVGEAVIKLDECASHVEFMSAVTWLRQLCLTDDRLASAILSHCDRGAIARIMSTEPTSEEDDVLLSHLLSSLSSLIASFPHAKAAPSSAIRFFVSRTKSLLFPILVPSSPQIGEGFDQRWGAAALKDALQFPPDEDESRLGLRIAVLEFTKALLEHDERAGLHLVRPAMSTNPSLLSTLLQHYAQVPVPSTGFKEQSDAARQQNAALSCSRILTRDPSWLLGPGRGALSDALPPLLPTLLHPLMVLLDAPPGGGSRSMLGRGKWRAASGVLLQLLAMPPIAALWRHHYLDFSSLAWLYELLSDREALMRSRGYSLAAHGAASLLHKAPTKYPFAVTPAPAEAGGESPQQWELFERCLETVLNEREADAVREQACLFLVNSTSPPLDPPAPIPAPSSGPHASSSAWSDASDNNNNRSFDSLASGKGKGVKHGGTQVESFTSTLAPGRLDEVINTLERQGFFKKLPVLLPASNSACCVRTGAASLSLLRNISLVDPATVWSALVQADSTLPLLFASIHAASLWSTACTRTPQRERGLGLAPDNGGGGGVNQVSISACPARSEAGDATSRREAWAEESTISMPSRASLSVAGDAALLGGQNNHARGGAPVPQLVADVPARDTIEEWSQWLLEAGPSAMQGAADACDILRGVVLWEQGLQLGCTDATVKSGRLVGACVGLASFKPSVVFRDIGGGSCDASTIASLRVSECNAHQAAMSLLSVLLASTEHAAQVAGQIIGVHLEGSGKGMMACVESLLSPSNPPSLRHEVCVFITALLSVAAPLELQSDAGEGEYGLGGLILKRLVIWYQDLFGDAKRPASQGDSVSMNPSASRAAVASAMSVLLAASPPAKDFALHSGFAHHLVSSLHDRIAFLKLQHARTPVDGGRKQGKGDAGKSDEHIVLSLRILSGLLNRAVNETKEEVISMGLPQAVHKLLSAPVASCQPGGGVFGMAMEVMANMAAGCEEGRLALARGYGGGLVGQQMTLLKKVLATCCSENLGVMLLSMCASVIGACVDSPHCLPVIIKSNLLSEAVDRLSRASDARDLPRVVAWIEVLMCCSVGKEAQTALIKGAKGMLEVLVRVRGDWQRESSVRLRILMILRNLAFLPAAKSYILAEPACVSALLEELKSDPAHISEGHRCRSLAANGILALVYNSQKAKTVVRKSKEVLHSVLRDLTAEVEQRSNNGGNIDEREALCMSAVESLHRAVLIFSDSDPSLGSALADLSSFESASQSNRFG